jgi:AbrB family looped-hinge helix DNA binding protein
MVSFLKVGGRGEVYIPVKIRKALGIKPGDRLRLQIVKGTITLKRKPSY